MLLYDQGAVMEKTQEQDFQTQLCNELQQARSLCSAQSKNLDREKYAEFQPKPLSLLLFKQSMQILLSIY